MKKVYTVALLLFISFQLTSCLGKLVEGATEKNATVEKGAIPADFGSENTTLLIVSHNNKGSIKKNIEKIASKYYHGKYEVLTKDDYQNPRYNDKEKYRYVLYMAEGPGGSVTTKTTTGNLTTIDTSPSTTYRYAVLDRKEDKRYKCGVNGTLYTDIIQGYIINLEKQRVINGAK